MDSIHCVCAWHIGPRKFWLWLTVKWQKFIPCKMVLGFTLSTIRNYGCARPYGDSCLRGRWCQTPTVVGVLDRLFEFSTGKARTTHVLQQYFSLPLDYVAQSCLRLRAYNAKFISSVWNSTRNKQYSIKPVSAKLCRILFHQSVGTECNVCLLYTSRCV